MKPYHLHREQIVGKQIEEVFAFFENPDNLSLITPEKVGFNILTPPPIIMKAGLVLDYTIKVLGKSVHWTTLITDYDKPYKFVDIQLKGPYKFWHHTHTFETTEGGTKITDDVYYIVPLGFFGRVLNSLMVKRQLKNIFDYRAEAISRHFKVSE